MPSVASFRSAETSLRPVGPLLVPAHMDFSDSEMPGAMRVRVLRTDLERQAIARLRRHAAFGVENDLGLGLQEFEQVRDRIGHVTAIYRDERLIASIRAVPTGHRLTGAERLFEKVPFDASILGRGSWELGRMIMEPEDRHPELLHDCLVAGLESLMQAEEVRHFHATTSMAMARLWRRVGMRVVANATGASGTRYALVHATVEDLMAALHMSQRSDAMVEGFAPVRRPASQPALAA